MKISKIIYYIVVSFIASIAVLLIISVLPITGNFKVMAVRSGSMEPTIKRGGIVVVKPVNDYKIGDVITFQLGKNKEPITHRIYDIKVNGGEFRYITKGDANDSYDPGEIAKKDIIGKVLFSVPLLGYVIYFAKQPFGFAIFIIIPAVILIFDQVKKILKEAKKIKNSKQNAKLV